MLPSEQDNERRTVSREQEEMKAKGRGKEMIQMEEVLFKLRTLPSNVRKSQISFSPVIRKGHRNLFQHQAGLNSNRRQSGCIVIKLEH